MVRMLLLDYSSAFDSIRHDMIHRKMKEMKFPTWMERFIVSYLSDREIYTELEGHVSKPITRTTGLDQGTVLAPLLFCIATSDLVTLDDSPKCRIIKYADDTLVLHSIASENDPRPT